MDHPAVEIQLRIPLAPAALLASVLPAVDLNARRRGRRTAGPKVREHALSHLPFDVASPEFRLFATVERPGDRPIAAATHNGLDAVALACREESGHWVGSWWPSRGSVFRSAVTGDPLGAGLESPAGCFGTRAPLGLVLEGGHATRPKSPARWSQHHGTRVPGLLWLSTIHEPDGIPSCSSSELTPRPDLLYSNFEIAWFDRSGIPARGCA
jgi:hypothetical protein